MIDWMQWKQPPWRARVESAAWTLALTLTLAALGCSSPAPAESEASIEPAQRSEAERSAAEQSAAEEWTPPLPIGFPMPEVPPDNPLSRAKVELGRFLFYDTRLSGPGTHSCASCHRQELAFTDGRARALGATGAAHPRSAMSLANVAYRPRLGWAEPELDSLEAQLRIPLFNETPIEMGLAGNEELVIDRFRRDPDYPARFARAFPEDPAPIRLQRILDALASFERTLVSGNSAYDRLVFLDDRDALDREAKRGMRLFFSAQLGCAQCHSGLDFAGPQRQRERRSFAGEVVGFERFAQRQAAASRGSEAPAETSADSSAANAPSELRDLLFFNTGLYDLDGRGAYPAPNHGLLQATQNPEDMGRFRVPTLRNVAVTAPYMHDGSIATLEAVIDHYAMGGRAPNSPRKSQLLKGFELEPGDRKALVRFLESLTDREFLTDSRFANPFSPETTPTSRAPTRHSE